MKKAFTQPLLIRCACDMKKAFTQELLTNTLSKKTTYTHKIDASETDELVVTILCHDQVGEKLSPKKACGNMKLDSHVLQS
jgi:hypothetical protein